MGTAAPAVGRAHYQFAFGIVFLSMLLAPGPVAAQGRGPADAQVLASYRLTMPTVRNVLGALQQAQQDPEYRKFDTPQRTRQLRNMSLAELAADFERVPPVKRALGKRGVPAKEAAIAYGAIMAAMEWLVEDEVARSMGGRPPRKLGPGAERDNVTLLQQNKAEIERLTEREG